MATTRTDARAERLRNIESLSANSFSEHVIEHRVAQGVFRHWRCAKPGDRNYAFNVTTIPGRLILTGDLGCLILERTEDMIPWCRGSIESTEYFAEKVPREMPVYEYDPEVARQWCRETKEQAEDWGLSDDEIQACYDVLDRIDDLSEGEVYRILYDAGFDDLPRFQNFTNRFLWQRQALKWFLENLKS